ncbi:Transcription elongation factor SPT5 [Bienertia sinuspersici]
MHVSHKCPNSFHCIISDYDVCSLHAYNLLLVSGSPYISERSHVWNQLSDILSSSNQPFVIQGDFNQIESLSHKWGGSSTTLGSGVFNNWLTTWNLIDIPYHRIPFTWCNNREGDDCVYERLDRVYVTQEWLHFYPKSINVNFPISLSDHSPILFDSQPMVGKRKSPIKMESWCLGFNEVQHMIQDHWHSQLEGSPMYTYTRRLKSVRFELFKWCKSYKQRNFISWDEVNQSCAQVQMHIGQQHDHQAERLMRQKVVVETQVKLDFWKQRAKGRWLELANTNTKFFYRRAQSRKKRNEILLLQNQDGTWVQSKPEIHALLVNHFKGILGGATGRDNHNNWQAPESVGMHNQYPIYFLLMTLCSPLSLPMLRALYYEEQLRNLLLTLGKRSILKNP